MAQVPRVDQIEQSVAISGFTDDKGASGHIDLDDKIPAGSLVLCWVAETTTVFSGGVGNGAETFLVGTPGEPDAFTLNDPRLLERGTSRDFGDVPKASQEIGVERTVRLTVTDLNDFGNISGGALTIKVVFVRTAA